MQATSLVIDCDPGIDDAVALALALASPEVDLRAVTAVAGNAPLELTSPNASRLLAAFGRSDVPVAPGADRALVRVGWHGLPSPHGDDGLGGVQLDTPAAPVQPGHAVDALAALLRAAAPHSVTIAAIGPLTNIALLLALHPECAERVDRLVVMGGSTSKGNITPVAEFNVWTDPEAAQRVLADSELRICLVGLDVTRRATVDGQVLDALRAQSPQGDLLARMVLGYGDRAPDGWPLHDVLAVAAVIDPTLVTTRPAIVEVDTGLGPDRGRTVCRFLGEDPSPSPRRPGAGVTVCDVAVDVDVERFRALVLARAAGSASSGPGSRPCPSPDAADVTGDRAQRHGLNSP